MRITVCGSLKFKSEMESFAKELISKGLVVRYPTFESQKVADSYLNADPQTQKVMVMGWTYNHFQWIKESDYVFVFNKEGKCGNSTTLEIGYAKALGIPVVALEHDEEMSREVLYDDFAESSKEFIQLLGDFHA